MLSQPCGNYLVIQASGAYIFRPNRTTPFIVNPKPEISVVQVRVRLADNNSDDFIINFRVH